MANIRTSNSPSLALATWLQRQRRALSEEQARRRVYSETHAALAALDDRELADIGVARSQIAALAREASHGR